MSKEEIKELKDYHKRCIESIDNYYLSDSFYEIHNKVFKELEELHNKIDKAIELYKNCKAEDYCTLDLDMYNALIGGDIDECE